MGPCFDGSDYGSDLGAVNAPFNGDGNCYSVANKAGYRIPVDNAGTNMLTNLEDV